MSLKADIRLSSTRGESVLPDVAPIFPLADHVLMPGTRGSYRVFEPRYRMMLEDVMQHDPSDRWIAIPCLAEQWREQFDGSPSFYRTATIAKIESVELGDDHHVFVGAGIARCRLTEIASDLPYRMAEVEPIPDAELPAHVVAQKTYELLQATMSLLAVVGSVSEELDEIMEARLDWNKRVYTLGSLLIQGPAERQQFIEDPSLCGRIDRLCGTIADLILMLSLQRAT